MALGGAHNLLGMGECHIDDTAAMPNTVHQDLGSPHCPAYEEGRRFAQDGKNDPLHAILASAANLSQQVARRLVVPNSPEGPEN